MQNDSRTILLGTLFILLFGMISNAVIDSTAFDAPPESIAGSWACTTEAKMCPDGSMVGRTPPYCQFAPCKN